MISVIEIDQNRQRQEEKPANRMKVKMYGPDEDRGPPCLTISLRPLLLLLCSSSNSYIKRSHDAYGRNLISRSTFADSFFTADYSSLQKSDFQ